MSETYATLQELQMAMRACRLCLEAGYTIAPGAVFRSGEVGGAMIIGQAPGVTEAQVKRPFNAGSGTRLFQWLGQAGWEEDAFRARHTMTAVTKCYPGKSRSGKGDRVPSKAEQALCRPFLEREMALIRPRLVIPVGGLAIKLFFPARLKLKDVIGTAVYFPHRTLPDLMNLDVAKGQWLRPQTVAEFEEFLATCEVNGHFIVSLPHPSGASLWPNKPANRALIDRAAAMLGAIRIAWRL